MNPHEEATVRAFIIPARRERWLQSLTLPKRRGRFLDRLNHCPDLDPRYAAELPPGTNAVTALRASGAPATCYVISKAANLDAQELSLTDAVAETELNGWGTLISCLPGQLAYYYGEAGESRMLLQRKVEKSARLP